MKFRLVLKAALCAVMFATTASAEESRAGDDEVVLKNGGTVRGTVTTVEPGKAVQIVEGGSKDIRVFAWSEVAKVEKAKYAVSSKAEKAEEQPPVASPPPASAEPQPSSDAPEKMKVHIDSPMHADLYRLRTRVSTVGVVAPVYGYYGYGGAYVGTAAVATTSEEAVCSAPCDKNIPAEPGDQFVLKGDFPTTKRFALTGDHPSVALSPGSKPRKWGGVAMASVGGVGIIGGIIALPIGASGTIVIDSHGRATTETNTTALAVGGTLLGLGISLVTGGVVMAATSGSGVDVGPGDELHGDKTALTIAPWVGSAPSSGDDSASVGAVTLTNGVAGVRGSF